MHSGSYDTVSTELDGRRILVVEDEAFIAMLIEDVLLNAGADVVGPAGSVDQALALIAEAEGHGGLSAAVLDMNLQGTMVTPVADKLAALGVPFVFATAHGRDCDRHGHLTAPMLHKPLDCDALVDAVGGLAFAGG